MDSGQGHGIMRPITYKVDDGLVWWRHQDQLLICDMKSSTLVSDSWQHELASAPFPSTGDQHQQEVDSFTG